MEKRLLTMTALAALAACEPEGPLPPVPCQETVQVEVEVGGSVTVDLCFTDPNGGDFDDFQFRTAEVSDWDVVNAQIGGSHKWIMWVRGVSAGTATVTVTAIDPSGLEGSATYEVTVREPAGADNLQAIRDHLDI